MESRYYYALGHEIRRKIITIIGDNEFTSFTHLKKVLGVSTGTIYHHLESLSELIQQKKDKKYYLKELGKYAYNSLKNKIESIKTPNFPHQELETPILRKFMKITSKRFFYPKSDDKLVTIILSLSLLIIGSILCGLNSFYSFLLFFIDFEQYDINLILRVVIYLSFFLNLFVFFIIIEGITRIFYKKNENMKSFLISLPLIQFPMIFYLIAHLGFKFFNLLNISIFNLLDKILLIIFQVWSLWLLSYSLSVNKELKIETSLIFSLLLHYGSFTIILFVLV
ncbi:MAG: winged helix-turn-helix domain-containing protein [Promethearchaeota archaeon]